MTVLSRVCGPSVRLVEQQYRFDSAGSIAIEFDVPCDLNTVRKAIKRRRFSEVLTRSLAALPITANPHL